MRGVGVGRGVFVRVSGCAGLTLISGASEAFTAGELRKSSKRFSSALSSEATGVGLLEGIILGAALGFTTGLAVGAVLGLAVGLAEGFALGFALGLAEGFAEGLAVGLAEGFAEGLAVGLAEGFALGLAVGLAEGAGVGASLGLTLGAPKISLMLTLSKLGAALPEGFALGVEGLGVALGFPCKSFSSSLREPLLLG